MIFVFAPRSSLNLLLLKLSRASITLVVLLFACASGLLGQSPLIPKSTDASPRIRWMGQAGVKRYRIQIARDQTFHDVMFDGVVNGLEYVAADLPEGRYYWRVTSADPSTRQSVTTGQFEIKPSGFIERTPTGVEDGPIVVSGWLAATGEISQPFSAQLRPGRIMDFLGTNSAGTVYALDGATGIALWTASYKLGRANTANSGGPFVPLVLKRVNKPTLVIVGYERGLRALEGASGREVWKTEFSENFAGGLIADLNDRAGSELYLSDSTRHRLLVLNAETGQMESEIKLGKKPIGAPIFTNTQSLLIQLEGNTIEMRKSNGGIVRSLKLASEITCSPALADTARGQLLLVATRDGLNTFDLSSFQLLGRSMLDATDYPTGALSVADLDGNGRSETVVVVTRLGKVVAFDLTQGRMKWFADGVPPGSTPSFVDLNGDRSLDVVLPAKDNFAIGISGLDGTRIWESPSPPGNNRSTRTQALRLATADYGDRRIMLVGNDPSGIGLRALELSKGSPAAAIKQ